MPETWINIMPFVRHYCDGGLDINENAFLAQLNDKISSIARDDAAEVKRLQERCTQQERDRTIAERQVDELRKPVRLILFCPKCGERHVDEGAFAEQPHHTHACQECGFVWRPAVVNTVGVRFLPGFRDP